MVDHMDLDQEKDQMIDEELMVDHMGKDQEHLEDHMDQDQEKDQDHLEDHMDQDQGKDQDLEANQKEEMHLMKEHSQEDPEHQDLIIEHYLWKDQ